MKHLKNIFILVLGSLFLLSACAGVQPVPPNRQLHEPDEFKSLNNNKTGFYTKDDIFL